MKKKKIQIRTLKYKTVLDEVDERWTVTWTFVTEDKNLIFETRIRRIK